MNCRGIQHSLTDLSLNLRQALIPDAKDFILDIDSTGHEQHGAKIEGVEWNYKGHWCLDSLQAYDQYGFQYWLYVRPGATFTSNGLAELIHQVFKKVPKSWLVFFVLTVEAATLISLMLQRRQRLLSYAL
jgi:hypothetical protein